MRSAPGPSIALLGLVAAGTLAGRAVPASAQSRRYPPAPVDKDAEDAARSKLWSATITPERHPYQALIHAATAALAQRTPDQTVEAVKKLDQAIQLMPRDPEAYRMRGDIYLERQDWARCAADFAAAEAHTRRGDEPPKLLAELRKKLAMCQAHAGKLADAEHTLAETVASGTGGGDVWTRLGEVRIAMGKLDEAIAALRSVPDAGEQTPQAMVHFLLAMAYDRARRPADARLEATEGLKLDKQLTMLKSPPVTLLGAGEADYMLALVYSVDDPPQPELALVHFRRFEAAEPDSPWRKRAEDHIKDLRTAQLPEAVKRLPGGTAPLDLDAARVAVRRAMPQMRACLARLPAVVVDVEISRAGPRTPATDRIRTHFSTPPDGVAVKRVVGELSDGELDAVDRCLQPLAARIALPPVKERDAYYKATFHVVGP
ncbi:MAG TPA: hypothetical protein VFT22_09750 [Kofleriaceae bacterium]|nr:hypothetical protein [Kofleriaceae bacterium]